VVDTPLAEVETFVVFCSEESAAVSVVLDDTEVEVFVFSGSLDAVTETEVILVALGAGKC
jgi:hypothetical protein